jgi:hypothetical protein
MDLKDLLNTGKSPLTLSQINALIESKDISYKLKQITDATFAIPTNSSECYVYFDQYLQLLASFDCQNSSDLDSQYTTTTLKASLRACVNDLLVSNGLLWLLSLPHHISHTTWTMLGSSPTILVYVYGLVLAMAKRQQVSASLWTEEMAHFVKAASASVNVHLWLSVCGGQQDHSAQFLDYVEAHVETATAYAEHEDSYRQKKIANHVEHIREALIDMLIILENGDAAVLSSRIDQYLGNVSLRPPFDDQELILGKIAFDHYIEKHKKTSLHLLEITLEYERQRNSGKAIPSIMLLLCSRTSNTNFEKVEEDVDLTDASSSAFNRNPLVSNVLMEAPPGSELERAHILEKLMAQWNYQLQTFPFSDFDAHLQQIIEKHYPNDRKTNLDLLLIEWIQKDEMESYLQTILSYIVARLQEERYDKRASPFWAILHLYSQTDYNQSEPKPLYGEISGAQVDGDEGWNDDRRQRTCDRILQILTDDNDNGTLAACINDILQVASSRVLAQYLEWMARKVNSLVTSKDRRINQCKQDKYYKQLNEVFKGEHIKNKADIVIPTLMRTLESSLFFDLVENRAYLNAMLKAYFSKPPEMAIERLVNELLRSRTTVFMLNLFKIIGARNRAGPQWFSNHFLGPILEYDCDPNSRYSSLRQGEDEWLTHSILSDPILFPYLFLQAFDDSVSIGSKSIAVGIKDSSLQLLQRHPILKSRPCGLLRFFEETVKLPEKTRDLLFGHAWPSAWGTQSIQVDTQWLLCCCLFFGQASVGVKSMIDSYMRDYIDSIQRSDRSDDDRGHELYTKRDEEQRKHTEEYVANGRQFIMSVVDQALLSDMVDPEDVFTMLIARILIPFGEDQLKEHPYADEVLYRVVTILTESANEIELVMEQVKPPLPPPSAMEVDDEDQVDEDGLESDRQRKKARRDVRMKKGRSQQVETELPSDLTSNDPATDLRNLCLYAQRITSIILSLLTNDGIRLMTPEIRTYITRSWASCREIYEPLGFLMTLESQGTMNKDIRNIISILRKSAADMNKCGIESIIITVAKHHKLQL